MMRRDDEEGDNAMLELKILLLMLMTVMIINVNHPKNTDGCYKWNWWGNWWSQQMRAEEEDDNEREEEGDEEDYQKEEEDDDGGGDDHDPSSPAPPRSTLAAAPPMNSVASVTASLRDDVGCIWAQAAGSLSLLPPSERSLFLPRDRFTAQRRLTCPATGQRAKVRDGSREWLRRQRPKTCASIQKLDSISAAVTDDRRGRLRFANATSQVRQRQQPLRLAPPWYVLTLHAIKKIKQRLSSLPVSPGLFRH